MSSVAISTCVVTGAEPAAVTMDVFDTALTRCWARPAHAFLACAQRMQAVGLIDLDDESWMRARQSAETRASTRQGANLATLADIYDDLAQKFGWTPAEVAAATAIELDTEIDSVRPVPGAQEFCQRLARAGRPLRFLSDMYLTEQNVTRLLEHVGYAIESDQVWVSSQRRASKHQGRLYALALAAWRPLRAKQVLHIGDNGVSDVQRARRMGLQAVHVADTRLPRGAQRLLEVPAAPLALRSLLAGAMRLALLQEPTTAARHDGLWQLGSCHAGPMLTLYVWWLLAHAESHQVRRLYFLARDGQVLLDIAQALQAAGIGANLELRYLHASRQAWFAPSLTEWNEATLFRLLDEPDRLSDPAKLARRLGLADAAALNARWPDLAHALRTDLSNREVAQLLVQWVPPDEALAHTSLLRQDTLNYLQSHGLFDGEPWAIVDLGWRGRMQECLARIVQGHAPAAGMSATGYYLALSESPRNMPLSWQAHAFCPDRNAAHWPGPAHLFELLCEATHGSTRGYAEDAQGHMCASFGTEPASGMNEWGLATYRQAVRCYAEQLAGALPLLGPRAITHDALLALNQALGREFFNRPEPAVANGFGRMPCSHSINHDAVADLAPPLGRMDAWVRALSLGRWRLSRRKTDWLPGSLARSDALCYRVYVHLHRTADRLRMRLA
jgi:FMN phosphatase YigB (HAD superfamily)